MKKWKSLHRWVSFPLGLLISLICLSGALLAFEHELTGGEKTPFFSAVHAIHRSLAIGHAGKILVGISMVGFIAIMISGTAMWTRQASRNLRLSLSLRHPSPLRGMHVALGIYLLPVMLICALTGLVWSFDWFGNAVRSLFAGQSSTPVDHTLFQLHTGRIFGLTGRILWCLASLLGATLTLTGYALYFRHHKSHRQNPANKQSENSQNSAKNLRR